MIPLFIHQKKHPWQDQQETFGENEYSSTVVLSSIRKMGKNPYNPRVTTVGRTTTDEAHQKMYKEKESKAKKEKEKEERKKARDKKQETKLLPGEKKNKKTARKKERLQSIH